MTMNPIHVYQKLGAFAATLQGSFWGCQAREVILFGRWRTAVFSDNLILEHIVRTIWSVLGVIRHEKRENAARVF